MDPNMMSSMMSMLNNPEMMNQMKEMMNNPQMQEMMNNPELMKNVMSMFGASGMPPNFSNEQEPTKEPEQIADSANTKFSEDDKIVLSNLKTEEYNGKEVKVISFNETKQRYVVEIEGGKQLLVKEDNLCLEEVESDDLIEVN